MEQILKNCPAPADNPLRKEAHTMPYEQNPAVQDALEKLVDAQLLVAAREYAEAHREAIDGSLEEKLTAQLSQTRLKAAIQSAACAFAATVLRVLIQLT